MLLFGIIFEDNLLINFGIFFRQASLFIFWLRSHFTMTSCYLSLSTFVTWRNLRVDTVFGASPLASTDKLSHHALQAIRME